MNSPEPTPVGTVAVIWVSDWMVKVVETPSNSTADVPVRPDPVRTTEVPVIPAVGFGMYMVGAGPVVTVKGLALEKEPLPFLTTIVPVVAALGTVADSEVGDSSV